MLRTTSRRFALVAALSSLALGTACSKSGSDDDKKHKPPSTAPTAPGASAPKTAGATGGAPGPVHGGSQLPPGHPPMGGAHGGPTAGPPAGGGAVQKLDDGRYQIGSLKLGVPEEWQAKPVTSSMRRAHYVLPGESTELIVYYFGSGGAGPIQANIDRWVGQFSQADGTPSKSTAKVTNFEAAGMKVTQVDVSGRYVAAMTPGAEEKHDKPDYRMIASIVEAPDGAYYFKLLGPKAEVDKSAGDFDKAIKGVAK